MGRKTANPLIYASSYILDAAVPTFLPHMVIHVPQTDRAE